MDSNIIIKSFCIEKLNKKIETKRELIVILKFIKK